jgi:putative Ca2+/H+ antiporter (TMEM165/GDT1 family)
MDALLVSLVVVAVGEMGDKTQLLALVLAARYRKPLPIILGIVAATLANHTVAAWVGIWIRDVVPPEQLRLLLALSFFVVAAWALKPDRLDDAAPSAAGRFGVFVVTVTTFFLAEIGDKTQIATVVLAAQFANLPAVIAGTTTGMLLADVPAVLLGHAMGDRIPLRWVRYVAAALFAVMGVVALAGWPRA